MDIFVTGGKAGRRHRKERRKATGKDDRKPPARALLLLVQRLKDSFKVGRRILALPELEFVIGGAEDLLFTGELRGLFLFSGTPVFGDLFISESPHALKGLGLCGRIVDPLGVHAAERASFFFVQTVFAGCERYVCFVIGNASAAVADVI
jgi:hypothetical protein